MVQPRRAVLFLAADPSDASRLRLGQELRDIQIRLRGVEDAQFSLEQRWSVRPGDLSQAIFDTHPEVVHFSGHGHPGGALALEDDAGRTHDVTPEALEALFALFAREVRCVILNACYSETQARAISKHIDFVIGMRTAIGDAAAIAFAAGFYKALAAGRGIAECFQFGRAELRICNIPEHHTPILLERLPVRHLRCAVDEITRPEHRLFAKIFVGAPVIRGKPYCVLVDPDAYRSIGQLLNDLYENYFHKHFGPFTYGSDWLLGTRASLLAPWRWAIAPGNSVSDVDPGWLSSRPATLGLKRGAVLNIGSKPWGSYTVVASNSERLLKGLALGAKFPLVLRRSPQLTDCPLTSFNGDDYKYIIILALGKNTPETLVHHGDEIDELGYIDDLVDD